MKRRELEAAAASAGLRVARPFLTSTLPRVRCTPEERERAEQLAVAAGISLAEHIRRRAIAPAPSK
jgi:hypothetical protein